MIYVIALTVGYLVIVFVALLTLLRIINSLVNLLELMSSQHKKLREMSCLDITPYKVS